MLKMLLKKYLFIALIFKLNLVFAQGEGLLLKFENEKFVRAIIDEIGIDKEIRIWKMSASDIALVGRNNAFVNISNDMYISEDFFEELDTEEKRFLIGHELMHTKLNHVYKKIGFSLVSLAGLFAFIIKMEPYFIKKYGTKIQFKHSNFIYHNVESEIRFRLSIAGISMGSSLVGLYMSRKFESQADRESVLKLKCFDGGINFFKKMVSSENNSNYFVKTILGFLSTHPSHAARIEQIEELKAEVAALSEREACSAHKNYCF